MKQWLSTFTAALLATLLAGLVLFSWIRAITKWEAFAGELTASVKNEIQSISRDDPSIVLINMRVMKAHLGLVQGHLASRPPLADATALQRTFAEGNAELAAFQQHNPSANLDILATH